MKSNNKKLVAKILLMLALGLYHSVPVAYALPSQGTLDNSKAATITTSENMMNIVGKGKNNILNWANFQIGKGETVKFNDKNNYLNLVHGVDISRIYGTLSGGNIVYLVNPNGILFGQGTKLDNVGSFVASTRNISSINKEAFLQDPTNTAVVLGTDNPVMDNKDYYPEDSSYVPKISVAEMQLTNVPASATSIILDGPGGVILKNTELLDQTMQVTTRKNGGEIGIGSDNGTIVLSEAQKGKIALLDGDKAYAYDDNANVLQGYQIIKKIEELNDNKDTGYYVLGNDIDANSCIDYKPVNKSSITFNGLGYEINNLKIANEGKLNYVGIFGQIRGMISNVGIKNITVEGEGQKDRGLYGSLVDAYGTGGLAGKFKGGNINNVYVAGKIEGDGFIGGLIGEGTVEIHNSNNYANIISNNAVVAGGVIGNVTPVNSVYNTTSYIINCHNYGDIKLTNSGSNGHENASVGGIVGGLVNLSSGNIIYEPRNPNLVIVGCCNSGDLTNEAHNGIYDGYIYLAGIVGTYKRDYSDYPFPRHLIIGDTYNTGKITGVEYYKQSGGILTIEKIAAGGDDWKYEVKKSSLNNKELLSYFIKNNITTDAGDFGIGISETEMAEVFNKDMIGVYDFSTYHGDVISGIPDAGEVVPPVNPDPDTPVVPPVNPDPDTPIVPPVNPEPDTPVVPPVEPESDGNVVKIPSDYDGVLNGIVNYDKEHNRIDINGLNDLYKNNQEKIQGGLELVSWEREKIKNDRREEAKEIFESKDYSDIIPENEIRNVIFSDEEYKGYLDIDGNMSVKNIKTGTITGNKNIKVTFDVYNRESISGVVEVYDDNGKMIKVVWIDPLIKHAESVDEAIGDFSRLVETDKLTAAITSVDIDVPAGGYFRVTNNADNSLELKVHNGVNHFLDVAGEVVDWICLALPDSTSAAVKEALYDTIKDAVIDELKSLPLDYGEDYVQTAINKAMDNLLNGNGENPLFTALVDNVKKDLSAKGVIGSGAEFTFNVVTSPIKVARELFFTSKGTLNIMDRAVSKNVVKNTKATNFVVAY